MNTQKSSSISSSEQLQYEPNHEELYFHMLLIFGYYRTAVFPYEYKIIQTIYDIIFNYYINPINPIFQHYINNNIKLNISFKAWYKYINNNGITLYSNGTTYYKKRSFVETILQYKSVLQRHQSGSYLFTTSTNEIYTFTEIKWPQFDIAPFEYYSIPYITAFERHPTPLDIQKYNGHCIDIFMESKQITINYYRLALIIFDVIWTHIFCV